MKKLSNKKNSERKYILCTSVFILLVLGVLALEITHVDLKMIANILFSLVKRVL